VYSQENIPVTVGIDDNVSNLTAYDGYLFFSANTAANVTEVFYYDNNIPVKVSSFVTDSDPQEFTVLNGKLYFSANVGSTDRLLHEITPNAGGYSVAEILGSEGANNYILHNNLIYFQGTSSIISIDPINPNFDLQIVSNDVGIAGIPQPYDGDRKRLFVAGDKLFFNKDFGMYFIDLSAALPNTNLVANTSDKRVASFNSYSSYHIGDKVLCNVTDSNFDRELYLVDAGEDVPTVTPISLSSSPFVQTSGKYFTQYMGFLCFVAFHESEGWRIFYIDDQAEMLNDFNFISTYDANSNSASEFSDPFKKLDGKLYHWSDEIDFTSDQISTSECFGGKLVISLNGTYYYMGFQLQSCTDNGNLTETCLPAVDYSSKYLIELNGELFFEFITSDYNTTELWKWSGSNVGLCAPPPCDQEIKPDLHVEDGDVYLDESCRGVIFTTSNDDCYRMTVNDNGDLETTLVTCPN